MNDPYYTMEDIPDPKKDPEFWSTLQSPHFKNTVNFLIINEIRKYNPEVLSDESSRSQLAKLKAYQELLDFPTAILNQGKELEPITDEITP